MEWNTINTTMKGQAIMHNHKSNLVGGAPARQDTSSAPPPSFPLYPLPLSLSRRFGDLCVVEHVMVTFNYPLDQCV